MYVIDASNVLGTLRLDRTSADVHRRFLAAVASVCRAKRTKALVIFDGPSPAGFGRDLGAVRAIFSAPESADDRIAREIFRLRTAGGGATVVTSDRGLTDRVRSRRVTVIDSGRFAKELTDASAAEREAPDSDDWERYFSDEKNRTNF